MSLRKSRRGNGRLSAHARSVVTASNSGSAAGPSAEIAGPAGPGTASAASAGTVPGAAAPAASTNSSTASAKRKSWLRRNLSTIILVAILVVGLCILAYPTFSDWWNSSLATRVATDYDDSVASLSDAERERIWNAAVEWNEKLAATSSGLRELTDSEKQEYDQQLYITGSPAISTIEIPSIRVNLPIYHGTDEAVLSTGIGHIEGSSLPVGGESTHCVISGHRGLPSAKLFTRLDELKEGDHFMLNTLGTTLTYEVDQIRIVLPDELDDLKIVEGEDLCTLVTCTPYGVNTHRLLVRGHRVPNDSDVAVSADALQVEPVLVACVLGAVLLLVIAIVVAVRSRKKGRSAAPGAGAVKASQGQAQGQARHPQAQQGSPPK